MVSSQDTKRGSADLRLELRSPQIPPDAIPHFSVEFEIDHSFRVFFR